MARHSVKALVEDLDARIPHLAQLEKYYAGRQALAYLSPEARTALGNRLGLMAVNYCRLAVVSLAERMRVTGFTVDGESSQAAWDLWTGSDLDQLAGAAHRDALALGSSYAIVWADRDGRPCVTVESAHQVTVQRDPITGEIVGAIKRWEDQQTGGRIEAHVISYRPDQIVHLVGKANTTAALSPVSTTPNPLGVVPVVELRNTDRVAAPPLSELEDLIPLVDALNKIYADQMVASEYYARPRRWATGLELEEDEDGNPVAPPESNRFLVNEAPDGKFGQLAGADLSSYRTSVDVIVQAIMGVSALPAHYVGITTATPAGADGVRAAEAALTARAESRLASFGRSWEQVMRLALAIENGTPVDAHDVRIKWADAATRSVAQEADAAVKLHAEGILTTNEVREQLGLDPIDEASTSLSEVDETSPAVAAEESVAVPSTVTPAPAKTAVRPNIKEMKF